MTCVPKFAQSRKIMHESIMLGHLKFLNTENAQLCVPFRIKMTVVHPSIYKS